MPRYLFVAKYSVEGAKGLLEKGGTSRQQVVAETAKSAGGTLESFDFAFGKYDAFVIVDLPDNQAAAKVALTVSAAGGASVETVVLLTPEQVGGTGTAAGYVSPAGR